MQKKKRTSCTSVLVGRKATLDGSTLIARNEDNYTVLGPKRMVVHPHQILDEEETFISQDNQFTMKLPRERLRYTATPDGETKYDTFEEDGINEKNVAMSATESIYANDRVLGYDPLVANGIAEDSMVTVVLPYISSAREGVRRLGAIIEKYGTAESNGILFSDKEEVWYMETATGHHWAAQRIPDDSYAVCANQMAIQEIDPGNADFFMTSTDLVEFIQKYHLNTGDDTLNFRKIFGTSTVFDRHYNTSRVWYGQHFLNPEIDQDPMSEDLPFLRKANRRIGVEDVGYILSSHYQETPYDPLGSGAEADRLAFRPISLNRNQESHILQIRPNAADGIAGIHWLNFGVMAFSPYVPFYANTTTIPEAYAKAPDKFSLNSAYWLFKFVPVIVEPHYQVFLKQLTDYLGSLHSSFLGSLAKADEQANGLDSEKLIELLNAANKHNADLALSKTHELLRELATDAMSLSKLTFMMDKNL